MHACAHTRCCCCYIDVCKLCYAYRHSPRPRRSVLELAFSKSEIFYFTIVVPFCMCMCVFVLICRLTHWNHKSEVATNGYIAKRKILKKGDLTKNVSFKSYGVICYPRAAQASQRCYSHKISFYASFENYSYVFTAQTTVLWKIACDSLAQTRKPHRYIHVYAYGSRILIAPPTSAYIYAIEIGILMHVECKCAWAHTRFCCMGVCKSCIYNYLERP